MNLRFLEWIGFRKMRKNVSTAVGVLLIAASASQMETAAARSVWKVARAPHPVTQQLRNAFGSWPSSAQSDHSNHNERHGLSAPTAVERARTNRASRDKLAMSRLHQES
jgi:hypothetical protein